MGRYANAAVRLDFPDLSEDDDPIYVTIKNPKRVPADALIPSADVDQADTEAMKRETFTVLAGLIVDWHVYDGNIDEDSDPLPLPATADTIASLPFEIVKKLTDEVFSVVAPPQ